MEHEHVGEIHSVGGESEGFHPGKIDMGKGAGGRLLERYSLASLRQVGDEK